MPLVDRAVASYGVALTEAGEEEARQTAILALAAHPDVEALVARERSRLADQGSGVQVTRGAAHLEAAARRKRGTGRR